MNVQELRTFQHFLIDRLWFSVQYSTFDFEVYIWAVLWFEVRVYHSKCCCVCTCTGSPLYSVMQKTAIEHAHSNVVCTLSVFAMTPKYVEQFIQINWIKFSFGVPCILPKHVCKYYVQLFQFKLLSGGQCPLNLLDLHSHIVAGISWWSDLGIERYYMYICLFLLLLKHNLTVSGFRMKI